MMELLEHPFFTNLIGPNGSDHHVNIFDPAIEESALNNSKSVQFVVVVRD